uniref:CCHC-type domain-containing protein n=1 Tax=Cannabis sativa TaxID=3483 RepID=A0A803PWE9_CANSA
MGRVSSAIFIVNFLGLGAFFYVFSMDLELVNRLAEVLVLDEGDGPVLSLNKAGIEEGKRRMDLCLVGKVIGPRPANKEGIEKAMKVVWKLHHRFQVEELSSKNVFRFFFGSREDRQRVYGGGPWTFDRQLICFVKPMGLGEISKMNFDFASFWISINNVPLACMTELFAREWGEQIGKLEDIKIVNGAMKVRVRINITEPLKRGLRVAVDDQGNEVSLIFQYEHLPDFCYDCGIIGHKALDCPLKDFAGENPKFDSGRFGSWMCAPSSPPRDRFRVQRNRESSPLDRPIMSMGEASRIVAAVGRNRVRYSGPTAEELAPTSVLEAREREEELVSNGAAAQKLPVEPEGKMPMMVDELGKQKLIPLVEKEVEGSTVASDLGGPIVVESVIPTDVHGVHVPNGDGSKGEDIDLSRVSKGVCAEEVLIDHSKQKLTKEQKGKGVIIHSSQEEISFSHALQQTFDPLIKAHKAKTWKRLNSSSGRGSKGVGKSSSFPISPKLSHVMVANAKYKLSPKIGGGGKRKMEVEGGDIGCVKKGRLDEQSDMAPEDFTLLLAKPAEQARQEP